MRVIALKRLKEFWGKYPDSEQPLRAWYAVFVNAKWKTPNHVKEQFRNASIIADNRVIFNIKGNNYRVVVKIDYDRGLGFIRFIGSHAEYDKINPNTI